MKFFVDPSWGKIPAGISYGEVASVAIGDSDQAFLLTRKPSSILVFDREGSFIRSFGQDMLSPRPHGITIGPKNIVYCVDEGNHAVFLFSEHGERLGHIGSGLPSDTGFDPTIQDFVESTASVKRGAPPFNRPTALAVAPDQTMYVADGYGNSRIHHYSQDLELIRSWGNPGSGQGEFRVPHGLCVTPDGRVLVADRENDRIQVFMPDGIFIEEWVDLHRPTDIAQDAQGLFYVTEFASKPGHFSWVHGALSESRPARLSVFDANGKLLHRFGHEGLPWEQGNFAAPHALAIDSHGDMYVAEVVASTALYNSPKDGLTNDWSLPADCHTLQKFSVRR